MDEKNQLDNATRRDLARSVLDVVSADASDGVKTAALIALERLCDSATDRSVNVQLIGAGSHTFTMGENA